MNIYIHKLFLAFLNSGKKCHGSPGRNKYRVAEVARIVRFFSERTNPQRRSFFSQFTRFLKGFRGVHSERHYALHQHQYNYNQKLPVFTQP